MLSSSAVSLTSDVSLLSAARVSLALTPPPPPVDNLTVWEAENKINSTMNLEEEGDKGEREREREREREGKDQQHKLKVIGQ